MLTIAFAVFIWPAILIASIVGWVQSRNQKKYPQQTYTRQTRTNNNNNSVRYETSIEEQRRINYYGYDDDRWGKL